MGERGTVLLWSFLWSAGSTKKRTRIVRCCLLLLLMFFCFLYILRVSFPPFEVYAQRPYCGCTKVRLSVVCYHYCANSMHSYILSKRGRDDQTLSIFSLHKPKQGVNGMISRYMCSKRNYFFPCVRVFVLRSPLELLFPAILTAQNNGNRQFSLSFSCVTIVLSDVLS